MWLDLALVWDVNRRRLDLVVEGGRIALDATPVTPMLLALGCDRRAEPDDVLPDGVTDGAIAAKALNPARGWSGDRPGARIGSRLWLLERAKLTDETLADAEDWAREALTPRAEREGAALDVSASRVATDRNRLQLDVRIGGVARAVQLRVGS